jgi:hypothetical protein
MEKMFKYKLVHNNKYKNVGNRNIQAPSLRMWRSKKNLVSKVKMKVEMIQTERPSNWSVNNTKGSKWNKKY